MAIIIKSIKGHKFPLREAGKTGYAYGTGLGFYDNESHEWIAGNDKFGSTMFPYRPAGGRKAALQILGDSGEFFTKQPRIKSL